MTSARVVLRGSESYTVNKKTWIKDVPKIVKGEETIKQFEANGYFVVKRIPASQGDAKKAESPPETGSKKFLKRTLPTTPGEEDVDDE